MNVDADAAKKKAGVGRKLTPPPEAPGLAAIGLEAEFALVVDGEPADPAKLFGTPSRFVRRSLLHRIGTSYHIPTGGAVYFDTGVIEVVTPLVEIEPGCAARAVRSLWEGIHFVRGELDDWERRAGRSARLVGFSTHYNVSFETLPAHGRGVDQLARLLAYILPVPVMIFAANRRSTGVGVRPRRDRVEVTVDFTPSPNLMVATATIVTAVAREVMAWPTFDLEVLERKGVPIIEGYRPVPHTSRRGWLARRDSFPDNPFRADLDEKKWPLTGGGRSSLRKIARRGLAPFREPLRRLADRRTYELIVAVLNHRTPTLLAGRDRPPEYDDVGRLCGWENLFPENRLRRSRYEELLIRTIAGQGLRFRGERYRPLGTRGWSRVVLERRRDKSRHVFAIDYLISQGVRWE